MLSYSSVACQEPTPRKSSGSSSVVAWPPLMTAINHCLPKGGQLTEFRLQTSREARYKVIYNGQATDISAQRNKSIILNGALQPSSVRKR